MELSLHFADSFGVERYCLGLLCTSCFCLPFGQSGGSGRRLTFLFAAHAVRAMLWLQQSLRGTPSSHWCLCECWLRFLRSAIGLFLHDGVAYPGTKGLFYDSKAVEAHDVWQMMPRFGHACVPVSKKGQDTTRYRAD
jgi:hypothetical protein